MKAIVKVDWSRGLPNLLKLHTAEVKEILEISVVFNALHRNVHGLVQNCKAEPRGREKSSKKTVDIMSTTVRDVTRHEAHELRIGLLILNYLGKYQQHTRMALSRASRGRRPKISKALFVANLRLNREHENQKGSRVLGIPEREVFKSLNRKREEMGGASDDPESR
jgi:hypothetical protein